MNWSLALAWVWRWLRRRRVTDMAGLVAGEHADVLAAYSALSSKLSELEREKRQLRKAVDAIPAGAVYAGWRKRFGEPAEVLDHDAVRELLAKHGHEVPKKSAAAPLIVEFVGRGEAP